MFSSEYLEVTALARILTNMFFKNIIKYCKTEKTYHTYYRLCESYGDEFGMPRQRMVLGLGRLLEIPDLDQKILLTARINELIKGTPTLFNTYKDQSVEQLAQHFYRELKAKKKIDKRPGEKIDEWEAVNLKTLKSRICMKLEPSRIVIRLLIN